MGKMIKKPYSGGGSKSPKGFRNNSSCKGFRHIGPCRVTCSECGISCEVPFSPSPDKPVYCSACFKKKRASRT
ncbi:MAG: CxxC-x17-CxxC domain-containing protein [Candidatus Woesearchaeota archaeon]